MTPSHSSLLSLKFLVAVLGALAVCSVAAKDAAELRDKRPAVEQLTGHWQIDGEQMLAELTAKVVKSMKDRDPQDRDDALQALAADVEHATSRTMSVITVNGQNGVTKYETPDRTEESKFRIEAFDEATGNFKLETKGRGGNARIATGTVKGDRLVIKSDGVEMHWLRMTNQQVRDRRAQIEEAKEEAKKQEK